MNVYGTSAEEFHSLAIALLRAQQTRQWLLDAEKSRERSPRTSHISCGAISVSHCGNCNCDPCDSSCVRAGALASLRLGVFEALFRMHQVLQSRMLRSRCTASTKTLTER